MDARGSASVVEPNAAGGRPPAITLTQLSLSDLTPGYSLIRGGKFMYLVTGFPSGAILLEPQWTRDERVFVRDDAGAQAWDRAMVCRRIQSGKWKVMR